MSPEQLPSLSTLTVERCRCDGPCSGRSRPDLPGLGNLRRPRDPAHGRGPSDGSREDGA